jgi:PhnB protein
MLKVTTSLHFAGDCASAFHLYAQCLGGKVDFVLSWGESPMAAEVPAEWHEKICYARVAFGNDTLVGGDLQPSQYQRPQGFSVLLAIPDNGEIDRIFSELAQGGDVRMPLQKTFWSERYGNLVDRFGIPWELNYERTS